MHYSKDAVNVHWRWSCKHVAEHYFTSRCTVCQNALEVALFCCGNWAAVLQY